MASNEKTSKEVASIASKALKNPKNVTQDEIQSLAASVLTQSPDNPKARKQTKPRK